MAKNKTSEVRRKLFEINKIISALKPEIRSDAFKILAPYYFGGKHEEEEEANQQIRQAKTAKPKVGDSDELFTAFAHERPSENVLLIAAWLYYQYGLFPITGKKIREVAAKRGVAVPVRLDNTIRYARRRGKKLFYKRGGGWQLTVHGQKYIKDTYNLKTIKTSY